MPEIPPPGTGNRSLAQLCQAFQLDCNAIARELSEKGVTIDLNSSLKSLTENNGKTSVEFYDLIKDVVQRAGT